MLRGDLRTTPLPELLQRLATAAATGCVYLLPDSQLFDAEEAAITLRDGAIYGVTLPSTRDALGIRLVATHQLTPADLAEAKLAQETELASWMLADLLIHLGLADEDNVQSLTAEQALSDLAQICAWSSGSWRFRRRARLGRNLPSPLPVDEALTTVEMRREQWHRLLPTILGADAVVSLASDVAGADDPEVVESAVEMDPDAFVLLCTVDGTRTVTDLANASGFTLLDAGRLTAQLVAAGLVQVNRDPSIPPLPSDVIESPAVEEQEPEPADVTAERPDALAAAFSFTTDGPLLPENIRYGFSPTGPEWEPPSWQQSDRLADALARVSAALSEAMEEPATAAGELTAIEFVEPVPTETLSELLHDEAAEEAEREAFLDTVEEPFDEAFLESVEAVTTHADPDPDPDPAAEFQAEIEPEPIAEPELVAEIAVPEPVIDEPVINEPVDVEAAEPALEEPVAQETASKPGGRMPNAAEASRMLSQLAGETYERPIEDAADAEDEAEPEPAEQHEAPAGYAPTPRRQTGPADTAALLRELSSLGAESGAAAGATSRPTAPRSAPSGAPGSGSQKGKRKGLFGRN